MALLTKRPTANALLALLNRKEGGDTRTFTRRPVQLSPAPAPWAVRWWPTDGLPSVYIPAQGAIIGETSVDLGNLTGSTEFEGVDTTNWYQAQTASSSVSSVMSVWAVLTRNASNILAVDLVFSPSTPTGYTSAEAIVRLAVITSGTGTTTVSQLVVGALSFGTGGAPDLVLGPMEYDSDAATVSQYAGNWHLNPASETDPASWTFVRATDAEGKDLPPAVVYHVAIGDVLLKQTADGGAAEVGYTRAPVFFPGDNFGWLKQKTAFVTRSVDYASPGSEIGMGVLSHTPSKITYFSNADQVVDNPETLLTTITEEANQATVYEGA